MKKGTAPGRSPLHVSVSDGRSFRQRRVTRILVYPGWWDGKSAALKKRTPIPEVEREALERELCAVSAFLREAYDAGEGPVGASWLKDTLENYYAGKDGRSPARREQAFDRLFTLFASGRDISLSRRRHYSVLKRMIHRYEIYRQISTPEKSQFAFDIDKVDLGTLHSLRNYLKDENLYAVRHPQILRTYPERRPVGPRSDNYLNSLFKLLKAFFSWCIRNGYTRNWPFAGFEMPREEYGTPIIMTLAELDRLYRAPMPLPSLACQRDIFVFQCLVGCRVGDLINIKKGDIVDGVLTYIPRKTVDERPVVVRVPLNQTALEIVARYADLPGGKLLPFISKQKYNEAIKRCFLAARLRRPVAVLDPVTRREVKRPLNEVASSHLARRTFIGNLYKEVADPNLIGSMSGHTEGSRAFARYRDIDDEMKASLVEKLSAKK